MNPEPHRFVTRHELWRQWDDAHCARNDYTSKAFDEIAQDYYGSSDACRGPHRPVGHDLRHTPSATHEAVANSPHARALLIEDAVERRGGGELDCHVDPVQVIDLGSGSCRDVRCRGRAASGSPLRPLSRPRKAPRIHACRIAEFRP